MDGPAVTPLDAPRRRDASTPCLLALLLLVAAAPLTGAGASRLPDTPASALAFLAFVAVAWAAVVVPSLSGATPARVAEALLVAAPFGVALVRADPGATLSGVPGLLALAAIGALAASLQGPLRERLAAAAAIALAAPALAAGVGLAAPSVWPRPVPSVRAPETPGEDVDADALLPTSWRPGGEAAATIRPGALARTPPAARWAGAPPPTAAARWVVVPVAAAAGIAPDRPAVRVVGEGPLGEPPRRVSVVASATPPAHPFDLDAFDATVLLSPRAAEDGAVADALAGYARRGGLLVGPHAWPDALVRRLGDAAMRASAEGPAPVGLGHVATAESAKDLEVLVGRGLPRPRIATAFDRAFEPPPLPAEMPRWRDTGTTRPAAWWLLVLFAAAATTATTLRGLRRPAAIAALSALASVAASLSIEPTPRAVASAFVVDVGGAGARRLEGVAVAAGPRGYVWDADLRSEGALRAPGFRVRRVDGRLRLVLGPRQTGWLVEETLGRGGAPGCEPVEDAPAWARALLEVPASSRGAFRWFAGSTPYGGPVPPGVSMPDTAPAVVAIPAKP